MRITCLPAIALLCLLASSCGKTGNAPAPDMGQAPTSGSTIQITSFAPAGGPIGTRVAINGSGFSTNMVENEVCFNGIRAVVVSATATTLVVTVPTAAGTGKITVKWNTATASSATDFNYIYTVSTLAGDGSSGLINGTGNTARFMDPYGVATDVAGNVYVADASNNVIRKITPAGVVSTLAGDGSTGFKDGDSASAEFNYPHGLAVDAAGNVFVADASNNRIRKITPAGVVSTVAGTGYAGLENGAGNAAEFFFPADIVIDNAGNLYVSDGGNKCIRKITQAGVVSTFATGFGFPEGITMDAAGNLFIADAGSFAVRKVTPTGIVSIVAGSETELNYVDGPGNMARFHNPEGIAIDKRGNLYVCDLNAAIRRITPDGIVSTIAGNGTMGFMDGLGIDTRFRGPSGIATDAFGNIYVCDVINQRIRKLQ